MMSHATMEKFGYPGSLIRAYGHWAVLLRPKQATLGALVLACTGNAKAFPDIGAAAFTELAQVTADGEAALRSVFSCDKMNYIMLMMVDPHVHFHMLPRYAATRHFGGAPFADPGWPGPPDIGFANETNPDTWNEILRALRAAWPA